MQASQAPEKENNTKKAQRRQQTKGGQIVINAGVPEETDLTQISSILL
jgi:hypothetical protein